jgi:hypothetical protein
MPEQQERWDECSLYRRYICSIQDCPEGVAVAAASEALIMASISRAMLSRPAPLADAHVHPIFAEEPIHQSCVKPDGGTF